MKTAGGQKIVSDRFDGKVVLITGAGSGLGRAAALQVAKEGAKLSLVDLNEETLEETKRLVSEAVPDAEVLLVTADVSDEAAVKRYVDRTVDAYGRIDGFFNNAGIEGRQNLTEDYGSDEFLKVVSINLRSEERRVGKECRSRWS